MERTVDPKNLYIAYTDSSFHLCRNEGAYGYILLHGDEVIRKETFRFKRETNNRGELRAIIAAVRACPDGADIEIRSDSQYAVNTLTGEWLQRRNTDLFKQWHALFPEKKIHVTVKWIRAHSGDMYNEMCDQMCVEAAGECLL